MRLYPTAGCTGTPAATGTAAAFASPGLTVTVAAGSTTTFRATATDGAGNASACSTSSLTYVHDSTAPAPVVLTSVTPPSPNTSTTPVGEGHRGGGVDGEAVLHRGLHWYAGRDGYGGGVRRAGSDGDRGAGQHDDVQGDRDGCGGEHLGLLDQLADLHQRPARRQLRGRDRQSRQQPLLGRSRLAGRVAALHRRHLHAGSRDCPTHGQRVGLVRRFRRRGSHRERRPAGDDPRRQRGPVVLVPEQLRDRAVRRGAAGPGRRDDGEDPHRVGRGGRRRTASRSSTCRRSRTARATSCRSATRTGRTASTTWWWTTWA